MGASLAGRNIGPAKSLIKWIIFVVLICIIGCFPAHGCAGRTEGKATFCEQKGAKKLC
jgi:hypothetical protein